MSFSKGDHGPQKVGAGHSLAEPMCSQGPGQPLDLQALEPGPQPGHPRHQEPAQYRPAPGEQPQGEAMRRGLRRARGRSAPGVSEAQTLLLPGPWPAGVGREKPLSRAVPGVSDLRVLTRCTTQDRPAGGRQPSQGAPRTGCCGDTEPGRDGIRVGGGGMVMGRGKRASGMMAERDSRQRTRSQDYSGKLVCGCQNLKTVRTFSFSSSEGEDSELAAA